MFKKIDTALNVVLTIIVLILAVVVVRRGSDSVSAEASSRLLPVEEWDELLAASLSDGVEGASTTIVVLNDLQCPFCKRFHEEVLQPVIATRQGQVEVRFAHYPIPNHAYARPAAEALECANLQGRGPDFISSAFALQHQFGMISWSAIADSAGVSDRAAFDRCLESPPVARIDEGGELGRRMRAPGRPTVIVNGYRFRTPPDRPELERILDSISLSTDGR